MLVCLDRELARVKSFMVKKLETHADVKQGGGANHCLTKAADRHESVAQVLVAKAAEHVGTGAQQADHQHHHEQVRPGTKQV